MTDHFCYLIAQTAPLTGAGLTGHQLHLHLKLSCIVVLSKILIYQSVYRYYIEAMFSAANHTQKHSECSIRYHTPRQEKREIVMRRDIVTSVQSPCPLSRKLKTSMQIPIPTKLLWDFSPISNSWLESKISTFPNIVSKSGSSIVTTLLYKFMVELVYVHSIVFFTISEYSLSRFADR